MTQRIKEFMQQAGTDSSGKWMGVEHAERFAELIVRECAGVTLDYKNGDHYAGWCDHAKEILKHFGVEE